MISSLKKAKAGARTWGVRMDAPRFALVSSFLHDEQHALEFATGESAIGFRESDSPGEIWTCGDGRIRGTKMLVVPSGRPRGGSSKIFLLAITRSVGLSGFLRLIRGWLVLSWPQRSCRGFAVISPLIRFSRLLSRLSRHPSSVLFREMA